MKKIILIFVVLLLSANFSFALEEYKPYLHKPSVPEHPKLKQFGSYTTDLFPGAAAFSYPLEVPPGTNGLTPSLSISYNSQQAKQHSILGSGWSFTKNAMFRDTNGTLNDTKDDEFRLFLENAAHNLVVVDGAFKTQIEQYWKIENLTGAPNTYGTYWLVTVKDGTKYRFGFNPDSELASNTGYSYGVKWSLDQIEDTFGNTIAYTYQENPFSNDTGAVYLSEISYNNDGQRKIHFGYENETRPDRRQVYESGNKKEETRRLKEILAMANGKLVRKYFIDYINLNPWQSLSTIANISFIGSDNRSVLNSVSFMYYNDNVGYDNSTNTYKFGPLFSHSDGLDYGARLADVNNDGFVDVIQGYNPTYKRTTYFNDRINNWTGTLGWNPPDYISGGDYGIRFADVDNDGFTDFLQAHQDANNYRRTFLNTGSSWVNDGTFIPPAFFANQGVSKGVDLGDVNGDGKVDIVVADDYYKTTVTYLNNGSGWVNASPFFESPVSFLATQEDYGVRFLDLNGDGLSDLLQSISRGGANFQRAWLNNGTGWTNVSDFKPPIYFVTDAKIDNGVRLFDINGDNLPDLIEDFLNGSSSTRGAYLNNGTGWVQNNSWQSPTPFTKDGNNIGRRLGDVNGDGFADIIIAHDIPDAPDELVTYIRNATTPYLLKSITFAYGGKTEIAYTASTKFNNTVSGVSTLGFPITIVANITHNNSLAGEFQAIGNYSYAYFGGKYDHNESSFSGFSIVNETKPDRTKISNYFHQEMPLKGREFKTETYNGSNSFFLRQENTFNWTFNFSYQTFLVSSAVSLFDGFATAEVTNTTYAYDSYGNLAHKNSLGDITKTGDEKYETYLYAYNASANILDKPIRYTLFDSANATKAKETRFFYDNLNFGEAPTQGALTSVIEWNSNGEDKTTEFEYDKYGNVIAETNALGYKTKYTFGLRDTTFTFANRITNALGHRVDFEYDLGTGNLLWQEKNNIRTYFAYDTFGRIKKEILPFDNEQLPTKEYNYSMDGIAPEHIKVSQREHANNYADTYFFYDGFGNVVQLKASIENNQSVTKNIFYDGLNRAASEQNPYFEDFAGNLSTPSNTTPKANYTYDALDRVTKVTNPDSTVKNTAFNKWIISDYDENNHRHDYFLDGYGRIVNVIEYNINPNALNREEVYNTSYEYDANDNLIKITDNAGNEFKFTYDSLGRKVKLEDPDLGIWTYEYDGVGNLIKQNDSRGNTTTLHYDALNRISQKNSTNVNISFTYDAQYFGTLTNLTVGGIKYRYTYDDRLRVIREERFLNGAWKPKEISYDSLNRVTQEMLPKIDLDYKFNKQGKAFSIPGFISNSSFTSFGTILNRTYSNSLVTAFSYIESNNRLKEILTGSVQNLNYTYDNAGNILAIHDSVAKRNYTMGYDALDRLTNTTINNDLYRYDYDSLGNMLKIASRNISRRLLYLGNIPHAPSAIIEENASAGVYALLSNDTKSRNRTFEFFILNDKLEAISSNWSIAFGNGVSNSSNAVTAITTPTRVSVTNNYSTGGSYTVNVSTPSDQALLREEFGVTTGGLQVAAKNISLITFTLTFSNNLNTNISTNWNCSTGNKSSTPLTFQGNGQTSINFTYNFTSPGIKKVSCQPSSVNTYGNVSAEFTIKGPKVENVSVAKPDTNKREVSFSINNHYHPLTVTWTITSGNETHTGNAALSTNQITNISKQLTYYNGTLQPINITLASAFPSDIYVDNFLLTPLAIEKYSRRDENNTRKVISFDVYQYWPGTRTVSWNISEPLVRNASNLQQNKSVMVIIEINYTSEGRKEPNPHISSGAFLGSYPDYFPMLLVPLIDAQALYSSKTNTISEIIARSNSGQKNAHWRLETGYENITSSQSFTASNSSSTLIIIQHNYSQAGVYTTNASLNSSIWRDDAQGVVVI